MSVSYWLDKRNVKVKIKTDIAIIGGGITGVLLAYWMDKLGDIKVALIEKGEIGSGATGRNAGFLLAGTSENYYRMQQQYGKRRSKDIYSLTIENHNIIKEIINKNSISCDYTPCGSITAAVTAEELAELEKSADLLAKDGFESKLIGNDIPDFENCFGGILKQSDGGLNPVRFVNGVVSSYSENIELFQHCEVYNYNTTKNGVKITADKLIVDCEMAILAVNGYAGAVSSFLKGKVVPTRGQVLAVAPIKRQLFDGNSIYCDFGFEYFRQLPNGAVLLGGFRQDYRTEELGYSDETTENIQKGLEIFIDKHLPLLKGREITHRWSGVMGFSPDGLPLIGELPSQPGVMFIGGYTGHGLGFSAVLSKGLVQQLLNGRTDIPLGIFSIRRLI